MDTSFSFRSTKDDDVLISSKGRLVVTLRGAKARRFLAAAAGAPDDALQLLMARVTGNFKRGNERERKSKSRR